MDPLLLAAAIAFAVVSGMLVVAWLLGRAPSDAVDRFWFWFSAFAFTLGAFILFVGSIAEGGTS